MSPIKNDILADIVSRKRVRLSECMQSLSPDELVGMASEHPASDRSMSAALRNSPDGIIAEFKRRSPSKGWISADADPLMVTSAYSKAGASALSILTEQDYFGGSPGYLTLARDNVDLPVLRKDFIIDEYQLYESRLLGADAVLLIAACLDVDRCADFIGLSHSLGMEVLLEIHSDSELPYVRLGADMVGVNNRNLGTFVTDVNNSFRMAESLRNLCDSGTVLVSESGLSDVHVVRELRKAGYSGFLMGEHFMRNGDPGEALRRFLAEP